MLMTAAATPSLWEPPKRFSLQMVACDANVYLVRDLVDQATESWGLAAMRHTGRLILTELATNAARLYEGATIHAFITRPDDRTPVIEAGIWDPDHTRMPRIVQADLADERGRGLFMINALTGGRLGWFPSNGSARGKVVWARFGPNV